MFNRNNNMTNMTIKITPIKIGRREERALSICITYLMFTFTVMVDLDFFINIT